MLGEGEEREWSPRVQLAIKKTNLFTLYYYQITHFSISLSLSLSSFLFFFLFPTV